MKVTHKLLSQCFERILNQESIVDVAVDVGIQPANLSYYMRTYSKQIGRYSDYKTAVMNRLVKTEAKPIAVAKYTSRGRLLKKYSSIGEARRDNGLTYIQIKKLLHEDKEWKYL